MHGFWSLADPLRPPPLRALNTTTPTHNSPLHPLHPPCPLLRRLRPTPAPAGRCRHRPRRSLSLKSGLIEKVPFLSQLSQPAVFSVITQLKSAQAHIEDVIYTVGEHANHMYFLSSGRVLLAAKCNPAVTAEVVSQWSKVLGESLCEPNSPKTYQAQAPPAETRKKKNRSGARLSGSKWPGSNGSKANQVKPKQKNLMRRLSDAMGAAAAEAAAATQTSAEKAREEQQQRERARANEIPKQQYKLVGTVVSGDFFGSEELYKQDKTRRTLVKADTFCELEVLSFEAIKGLFEDYQEIKMALVNHQVCLCGCVQGV